MKERLLKRGVVLFLVAVLVVAGVLASHPVTSQAAAKGTTYNVTLLKGSGVVSMDSINGGTPVPMPANFEGFTFQMVVEAKAKTEKLSTGPATYYPVTIIAKSFKGAMTTFPIIGGGGTAEVVNIMPKDAKGKLYTSGGDVDVSQVAAKKVKTQIGDGTVDPAGSLVFTALSVSSVIKVQGTKKVVMTSPTSYTATTGKCYSIAKGSGTKCDGKALPDNDTSKTLPNPLVGQPVDLNAGTGTLAGTGATFGQKNKTFGAVDYLNGFFWVMKITHAS